jgi:flagellar operon protein
MGMNKIWIQNTRPINPSVGNTKPPSYEAVEKKPFAQVLDTIINHQDVKFSKHALQRLEARNIHLNSHEINRIHDGLKKASQKGIRETLILMDDKAFVASVHNKTIITAALDEQLKENVFTNIDGAVIV